MHQSTKTQHDYLNHLLLFTVATKINIVQLQQGPKINQWRYIDYIFFQKKENKEGKTL